jgi:hypothetical protein
MGFTCVFVEPPLTLWMWDEIRQPHIYWSRWGMPGWKWLG